MGLDPRIWGPKGWFFLHSIALNYPKNPTDHDKRNFKQFFESIQYVLPCPQCSQHYSENLQKNPLLVPPWNPPRVILAALGSKMHPKGDQEHPKNMKISILKPT